MCVTAQSVRDSMGKRAATESKKPKASTFSAAIANYDLGPTLLGLAGVKGRARAAFDTSLAAVAKTGGALTACEDCFKRGGSIFIRHPHYTAPSISRSSHRIAHAFLSFCFFFSSRFPPAPASPPQTGRARPVDLSINRAGFCHFLSIVV